MRGFPWVLVGVGASFWGILVLVVHEYGVNWSTAPVIVQCGGCGLIMIYGHLPYWWKRIRQRKA